MFSLYPNYLRKWKGGERPWGVIQISSDGNDQMIFLGGLIQVLQFFLGIQNNLKIQMVWWIKTTTNIQFLLFIFFVLYHVKQIFKA